MEGNVRYLTEYLRGATKLIIPVYQRNYDWKKENCKRLIDDLITLESEQKRTHFFGSIVVKPGDLSQEIIVIDGQQRLTTTSLLLLAMKNWMENNQCNGERINPGNLETTYLIDSFSRDIDKYKLKPNPRDLNAYKKLFTEEKYFVKNSNITTNYEYFYTELEKNSFDLDMLMNSIDKLQVMVVNLNSPDDDPQLIFESLNSTGVDLTDADKIRNFLLMNERQEEQLFYFNNYWEPIEERTHFQLSSFFRDYLTVKNGKYPNIAKVYETFIDFYKHNCDDKKKLFDELSDYSFAYQQILEASTKDKQIDEILNRFNELQVTVVRPFLLAILSDFNGKRIQSDEVVGVLNILETYIARRMIAKIPSNSLNKVIATLYRDIKKIDHDENVSTQDILSYILLSKTNTAKLPNDQEIANSLRTNDFYNINSSFRTYLFERLENFDHIEALKIYQGVKDQDYSIEHIMPRKLSTQWINELGDNYKHVHQNYIHQLGNLTLTGYNSKYSNKSFREKQTMQKGFKDSHFVNLNRIPAKAESWGENEINLRTEELLNVALKVWPYPVTKYAPMLQEKEMITFDGEQKFTNYQISGYSFITDEYQAVTSWKDFFVAVIKQLGEINLNPMIELSKLDIQNGLEGIFSSEPNAVNSEVTEGLYVYTSLSNWRKMNYIKLLLDLYKIEYDSLSIDAVLYETKQESVDN
ncbi:DUF262 domain-containing protein [Enterococcus sp. DIV0756]|uniref:DUF262 domain-containing protein n=1 Tax=Enterococcus sp. DIV0756 TaxID=2774636 RepID=UPI003F2384BD